MRRSWWWLCGVAMLSCAHQRNPEVAQVRLYKSQAPVPGHEGARLPLWLVDVGVIQGQGPRADAVAIVDTGAQVTVVDRQWAETHGLVHAPSAVVAKDIAGSSIGTSVARDVRLRFGGIETPSMDLVVIEMPEILRHFGIAVIWSPHTSVPIGALLRIDFARGTLQLREEAELVADAQDLCIGQEFGYAAPIVSATVGGHATRVELDSGSSDTSLSVQSNAGARLVEQAGEASTTTSHGAGESFESVRLEPQPVRVGEFVHTGAVSVFEPEPVANQCPSDGVIGLPFLAHCTLDLTTTRLSLRCSESAAASPAD